MDPLMQARALRANVEHYWRVAERLHQFLGRVPDSIQARLCGDLVDGLAQLCGHLDTLCYRLEEVKR